MGLGRATLLQRGIRLLPSTILAYNQKLSILGTIKNLRHLHHKSSNTYIR